MEGEITRVRIVPQEIQTISFFGTVGANSGVTLVSKRITVPFLTHKFRVTFALNTNRTVEVEFFISPDDSAPTSKPLTGLSVLSELGQVAYLVGDDDMKEVPVKIDVLEGGMYLKVWAKNTDSYEHTIDAQAFVQLNPRKGR